MPSGPRTRTVAVMVDWSVRREGPKRRIAICSGVARVRVSCRLGGAGRSQLASAPSDRGGCMPRRHRPDAGPLLPLPGRDGRPRDVLGRGGTMCVRDQPTAHGLDDRAGATRDHGRCRTRVIVGRRAHVVADRVGGGWAPSREESAGQKGCRNHAASASERAGSRGLARSRSLTVVPVQERHSHGPGCPRITVG
jgi:hypothetical protein